MLRAFIICFKKQIKINYEFYFLINTILIDKNEKKIKKIRGPWKNSPKDNKIIFFLQNRELM